MIQKFGQPEPDPDLNSDMTDCPNFKFGQNFYDRTLFFPGRTNPANRVGRIFASPSLAPKHDQAIKGGQTAVGGALEVLGGWINLVGSGFPFS